MSLETVDPLAVCSDGTPAGYYWKAATTNTSTWLVDLEGGGWCAGEVECRERCPPNSLDWGCSSKAWLPIAEESGLFRPARDPALGGANKIWVQYCSSDGHMGDSEAFGYHFRGTQIIRAIFKDLVTRWGLGKGSQRHLVIFGGQSAGARGAMVHLDYVQEMAAAAGAGPIDVLGFLDSPLWVDMEPYPGSGFIGFGAWCRTIFEYVNVTHLGAECPRAYAGPEQWKCIMGQYRMPYIQTPYLLVASQFDSFQLEQNVGHMPTTLGEQKYAETFAHATETLMISLRANWPASALRQNAVYSWACYDHAMSCRDAGYNVGNINGATLDAAMLQFLGLAPQMGAGPRLQWIDTCQGFACGRGCPKHAERDVPALRAVYVNSRESPRLPADVGHLVFT